MPIRIGTPADYYSSHRRSELGSGLHRPPHHPSVREYKKLALSMIICGLCTLLAPLVTVEPPVANAARWSPVGIVFQMYKGVLPTPTCERCGEPLVRSVVALPFTVTVIYLLMVGALVLVSIPYAARITAGVGALGALEALYLGRIGTRLAFHETFYGYLGGGNVHYGWLQFILFSAMAALCIVSLRGDSR
jgi:hypothetical protein